MKTVLLFCLVALCVHQVIGMKLAEVKENLKRLEGEIKESKGKVDEMIHDINKYRSNLQDNFNSKIAARESQDVRAVRCMTDLLLEEIRVYVGIAKAKGKSPEKCYENSKVETAIVRTNGFNDLEKCTKEAKGFVEEALTTIDGIVASGQELMAELDRIYPDCYSKLSRIMLKCVNRKMSKTDVMIKKFESSAASMKTIGDTAFNQGYSHGITCYHDAVQKTRVTVRNISVDSKICISKS